MENIVDIDMTEEKTEETAETEEIAEEAAEDTGNNDSEIKYEDDFIPADDYIEPPEEETAVKKPFGKILKITGIILGILAVIYIAGVIFYSSHFFFFTEIGGVDCSNLSVGKAAERIKTDIDGYVLTFICRDETTEQMSGKDISLVYEAMGSLEDIKAQQNPFLWATDYDCRDLDVDIEISYDEAALLEKLKSLGCVVKSDAAMEGAAENVYYDESGMEYGVSGSGSPDIMSVNKLLEKTKINIAGLYRRMYLEAEG